MGWFHKTDMGLGGVQTTGARMRPDYYSFSSPGGREDTQWICTEMVNQAVSILLVQMSSVGHAVNTTSTEGHLRVDMRTRSNSFYLTSGQQPGYTFQWHPFSWFPWWGVAKVVK